ncbi:winged helix-turn-helix domain-containing protein [Halostella litorea]|uniref:winged helix-turn-helix domain-containing protein n=1 Tax=Halostella litorea TaxID=2528831 RepID=UPI00138716FF
MTDGPYDERDEDTQQFTSTYPDSAFFDAISDCRSQDQLATTVAIAERVGCTRQSAYYRLSKLEDAGKVESRDAGGSRVWRLVEE